MCILALAYQVHPEFPLVLITNRDEFYARKTERAHFWEKENILAGKDLEAGGTWLGIHKNGRWALLTNFRDINNIKNNAPSRGQLALDFLRSKNTATDYLQDLQKKAQQFNGFNLLLSDGLGLYHYANTSDKITKLNAGFYSLSNALLDTPWPKTQKLKAGLEQAIRQNNFKKDFLFSLLRDEEKAKIHELPQTGLSLKLEEAMSSIFIQTPVYGTRCSTLLLVDKNGKTHFTERGFDDKGIHTTDLEFSFLV
ncbi:MAG TPA: NRDE family protein [Edaphocola sp.]|nr:NRDE family protein [Edaphocola sp.]